MNCPSRTDEPPRDAGWNQNPPGLSADLTTRQDLNGIVNLRTNQDSSEQADDARSEGAGRGKCERPPDEASIPRQTRHNRRERSEFGDKTDVASLSPDENFPQKQPTQTASKKVIGYARDLWDIVTKFGSFIGPGFIIAVAYIDPGNYSTDVAAGAATRFKLLFIVGMSNIFAIVLQSLAIRLGTITGMNLAEHCRAHLPRWMNFVLYILGEAAIIATDIAEVSRSIAIKSVESALTRPTGHWLSYSSKSPPQNPSRGRLRHYSRGCPCDPYILFTRRFYAPPAGV